MLRHHREAKTSAPPTAERYAQVQLLCTLGIIDIDQVIFAEAMKAYDGVFAALLPHAVGGHRRAIGRDLPSDPSTAPITTVITGSLIVT